MDTSYKDFIFLPMNALSIGICTVKHFFWNDGYRDFEWKKIK